MTQHARRGWVGWAVLALLLIMVGEIALSVRRESLTWDEGDHIFAGYMSLRTGDFGLNPEHPPMAKMVAALPLLPLDLKVPPLQGRFFKDEAYLDGRDLLYRNSPQDGGKYWAGTLIFRARMAVMVFSLLLGLLVFLAAREMFSLGAAFLALALYVFEPSVLTHAPFVTTDVTVSSMLFATIYSFYRFVKRPDPSRLVLAGVAAGLALAAKHSAILLAPMLLTLALGELAGAWWNRRASSRQPDRPERPAANHREPNLRRSATLLGALIPLTLIAIAVLWAFYGFRYSARPGDLRLAPTLAESVRTLRPVEAQGILLFARAHLLPESYLYGLADVRRVANFMPSFVLGRVYAHGVWWYFPVVLAIKLTLGMAGLLLLGTFALLTRRLGHGREVWFLLVPPAIYLLVAMTGQLNIGVRHILPIFPFLIVFAAGGAWALARQTLARQTLARQRRGWAWTVLLLLTAHIVSSLFTFPHYMSYSNELWGGHTETYHYLTDSNTDWGQELIATKQYIDRRGVRDCWIAYFVAPFILPNDYGIPCRRLPTFDSIGEEDLPTPAVITGPVLVSAGDLNGFEFGSKVLNPFQGFMDRKPTAIIQDGILVYDGTFSVPMLSAITHVEVAKRALKAGRLDEALREAQAAVQTDPGGFREQMILGDVLQALGRNPEARASYNQAMLAVQRMEPSAQEQWRPEVEKKLAKL